MTNLKTCLNEDILGIKNKCSINLNLIRDGKLFRKIDSEMNKRRCKDICSEDYISEQKIKQGVQEVEQGGNDGGMQRMLLRWNQELYKFTILTIDVRRISENMDKKTVDKKKILEELSFRQPSEAIQLSRQEITGTEYKSWGKKVASPYTARVL